MNTAIGWCSLFYADNHRISRSIGRKITCEAHQIVGSKSALTPNLRRTRFTSHGEVFGISQFTRTGVLTHHAFQTNLDVAEHFGFAHSFAQHHSGEFLHHFISSSSLGDKSRSHEFTSIRHTIVEGEGRNGGDLCFISNAHPRQSSAVPSVGIVFAIADAWFFVTWYGNVQIFHNTDALKTGYKLVGIARISVVDERTHPNVRRFLDDFGHSEHTVSPLAPVGVAHLATVHLTNAVSSVASGVHIDFSIFHRHHKRHWFKHRTRFHHIGHSARINFCIPTIFQTRKR